MTARCKIFNCEHRGFEPEECLNFDYQQGCSFKFIKKHPQIRLLFICTSEYEITLDKVLKYCPQIEVLEICSVNTVCNLEGISNCPNLRKLLVNSQKLEGIEDVSFCSELKELELTVREMEPRDWDALTVSTVSLERLFMEEMNLSSLTNKMLRRCTFLKKIEMRNCQGLKDLRILRGVPLKKLVCIESVSSLEGICTDELVELIVPNNGLTSVKPLVGAKKLKKLIVCNNKLTSIRHLRLLDLEELEAICAYDLPTDNYCENH